MHKNFIYYCGAQNSVTESDYSVDRQEIFGRHHSKEHRYPLLSTAAAGKHWTPGHITVRVSRPIMTSKSFEAPLSRIQTFTFIWDWTYMTHMTLHRYSVFCLHINLHVVGVKYMEGPPFGSQVLLMNRLAAAEFDQRHIPKSRSHEHEMEDSATFHCVVVNYFRETFATAYVINDPDADMTWFSQTSNNSPTNYH